MNLEILLVKAINAAVIGGQAIMKVYVSDFKVELKDDDSPLTLADKNCNEVIENYLKPTGIPFLSEEGSEISFGIRKKWKYLWLVDPLDGTKEFIKKNGEFTVNIALILKGNPIIGVIYVPEKEDLYFAMEGIGSFKTNINFKINNLDLLINSAQKLPLDIKRNKYVIVGSRSHMTKETEVFFEKMKKKYGDVEILSVGSSLKLCMVAEGRANAYPRYAPTMEWDTGAGHAIAKYAGFSVNKYKSNDEVKYNKEKLLNPWFLVKKYER